RTAGGPGPGVPRSAARPGPRAGLAGGTVRALVPIGVVLAGLAGLGSAGSGGSRGAAGPPPAREPLLVADFTNTTGEGVFDGALKDALEIQLQQSPFFEVVPASQLRSALRLMERSPDSALTAAVAREVGARLAVRASLPGA